MNYKKTNCSTFSSKYYKKKKETEKKKTKQNTNTMCVIGGITFMMVKKGKLNIQFAPEYHISSKNMCFYLINIVESIKSLEIDFHQIWYQISGNFMYFKKQNKTKKNKTKQKKKKQKQKKKPPQQQQQLPLV